MPIDKTKLQEYLNSKALLNEEKRMWYRIGFYVTESTRTDSYRNLVGDIVHADGERNNIPAETCRLMRQAIIEWWDVEKTRPRATEAGKQLEVGPYDELENRNSI